jgi:hypothetical protein
VFGLPGEQALGDESPARDLHPVAARVGREGGPA